MTTTAEAPAQPRRFLSLTELHARALASRDTSTPRRQRSTQALATESLRLADELTGQARREALRRHFDEYPPALLARRACRIG